MILYKIRQLHGRFYEYKQFHKKIMQLKKYIQLPKGKKVYFIGTPEYENLGDSAIAICETLFLELCGFSKERIKEFTQSEFYEYRDIIGKNIKKNDLICLIGGGNIGNEWYDEELFRYSVIELFQNNPIVIFPQTVYFSDDDAGREALKKSCTYYDFCKNLTIVAREKKSYDQICENYTLANKLLVPDTVLVASADYFGVRSINRNGVLCVFRNDAEQSMPDTARNKLFSALDAKGLSYTVTDMYSGEPVTKENRFDLVKNKLQEFADSKLVITDRLHGMVFSAITGTPCIVFSNYNHKVTGTYDWIKYLPYIRYADSVEKALKYMTELLSMTGMKFDNKPLIPYFDELKKVIKSYVD